MSQPSRPRWRICVLSTSRADYGCLNRLMHEVHQDPQLQLQLAFVGRHWRGQDAPEDTKLTHDGLPVALALEADPEDDTPAAVGEAASRVMARFVAAFPYLSPHVLVVLGDRFEVMAAALAAVVHNVPIAHIHGGELSLGAIDDSIRHALTKLSRLHFTATPQYAARVLQMGEPEDSVFCFGAPALDGLRTQDLVSREELAAALGLSFERPVALVTYHPATLEPGKASEQIASVLSALERSGLAAVLTAANQDAGGGHINAALEEFAQRDPKRYRLFAHLGQRRYFGCLAHCAVMIGNSSSGLIEAPSFELPVVNIGARQEGRVRGANVIDTDCDSEQIVAAIKTALAPEFRGRLRSSPNPYDPIGDGRTSWRIKEALKSKLAAGLSTRKPFADMSRGTPK
jgi:GDP/UDP-N,N'-diacetylbacillosamine 2-epimerase (hydrolysing)